MLRTNWLRPGGDGHHLDRRVRSALVTTPSLASTRRVRGRAYPPWSPVRGLRRGSVCSSPMASWDRQAGGPVSLEPRLGGPANSGSPRRLPVPVGQVRVSADDYGAAMTGTQRPTHRGQGQALWWRTSADRIPLPARRARDPLPLVAKSGHSTCEAVEYTQRCRSEVAAWPGPLFGLRPGQAMQLSDQ
jgi:hypothetical protein